MKNKLYILTKTEITRVLLASLMLAVLVIVIIVNFASSSMSLSNFAWSLIFILAYAAFISFCQIKNHTPLLNIGRVWMIISLCICFLGTVLSLAAVEFDGVVGLIVGFLVMIFVSPFYGFGFIINSSVAVCVFGSVASAILILLPNIVLAAHKKHSIAKKYR